MRTNLKNQPAVMTVDVGNKLVVLILSKTLKTCYFFEFLKLER